MARHFLVRTIHYTRTFMKNVGDRYLIQLRHSRFWVLDLIMRRRRPSGRRPETPELLPDYEPPWCGENRGKMKIVALTGMSARLQISGIISSSNNNRAPPTVSFSISGGNFSRLGECRSQLQSRCAYTIRILSDHNFGHCTAPPSARR